MKFFASGLVMALAQLALCLNVANAQEQAAVHTTAPLEYSVPAQAGVKTQVIEDGKSLSVAAAGIENPIIINLGWMRVQPRTDYIARYYLQPEALKSAANVYVMIREHEGEGVRPIQPYHRDSVRAREVAIAQNGNRLERRLSFTTGEKTQVLSGSIVVSQLNGELRFSAFELLDSAQLAAQNLVAAAADAQQDRAAALADYEKLMAEVRAQADARVPLTPRPLVFSRSQMKYGLEKNYYHQWNDRPLLVNRDYRISHPYVTSPTSYKRILQEVAKYDIDGLAFFPQTKDRMAMFDVHAQAGVPGVGLLPEFIGSASDDYFQMKVEIVERALKSQSTPRINGKVLITSYGAQSLTPAQWKDILDRLRAKVGDTFLFLPSLTNVVALRGPVLAGEPITREAVEKEKAFLRSYLDVCDGIYFNYPPALRNKDRSFDGEFYSNIFIPVFKSVLSEPQYQNKYLGLSAYRSHMSPERGNTLHEDGTRTLRRSFEAAMNARPDVILLPEWDEVNENTSFRPTVYGSTTSQRILRYYMSRIKSQPPTPVPGDDVSVPNLIVSTDKAVSLGEELMIELLNVPDSTTPGNYTVEVALQDAAGKVVKTFEPVTFDAAQLQEHRFLLATETVPTARALIPVITVRGYKGRDLVYDTGFHHVQVRGTWNWDHLAVKQPLRDLLRPTAVNLAWENPSAPGAPLTLVGSVSSPQDLSLVEVLGDDDEAYAVDPTNEFFRNDPNLDLFLVEYRSQNDQEMDGELHLKNAKAQWLTNGRPLHQPESEEEIQGDRIRLKTPVSIHPRWIYLAIPKASTAAAELDFNFDKAKFSVPLRDVLEKKMIAHGLDNGIHISVQPYHRQIDMPKPLNQKEVSFRVQIWPEIATEQYHLRLTAADGKLFRSRPLLVPTENNGAQKTLRVYSDAQQRGVDVPVAADRIPELNYEFAPERGAVLLTDAGRPFWATLGGFSNTSTGRGTINGLFRGKIPTETQRAAPIWETVDGAPALKFDGEGTYLELPREALPWRGAFTLGFDIKPASDKNQFLLTNRVTGALKGLSLEIRDGKLHASFFDSDWKNNRFATELAVPPNAWSTIQVRYDFENLTLSVNGQTESFPLSLPASSIGFTIIGEGWTGNWFEGHLRNLRIVHNAE